MGFGARKNETLVQDQLEAELLGQLIPGDLQARFPAGVALRSCCS